MTIWIVKYYSGLYNGVSVDAFSTLEKAKEFTKTDCNRLADDWAIVETAIDNPQRPRKVILKTDKN